MQRAIAGIGAAGVFSGSLVIIAHVSPIEKRPIYNSIVGGMFGIASVVGPLVSVSVPLVGYRILIKQLF